MPKFKATKYLRLSFANDRDNESDSISNQRKLIDSFLEKNPDIEVVSEKIDDGYSGIIFDRPAFQEMMQDIFDGKINCVIVKDLSRLGRDYIETGRHLRQIFPAYGVRFIAINDNIDTLNDSQADDLMVSIKSIMNDAYSRDASVKTRSALEAKRRNGDFVGASTIYGYKKSEENRNRLVIDEYPAKIVQDIFRMKIEGNSALKISEKLNDLGVLSPIEYKKYMGISYATGGFADKENSKWSATTIIRILKDETYTGKLIQGKQTSYSYKLKNIIRKPSADWDCTENAHEAIIRKQDFDLVQKIMNLDTRTSPNKDSVYIFSGILICGTCGSRMTRKTVTSKGKKYFYYYCPVGKKNGCAKSNMTKESDLIESVLNYLKHHIRNVSSLEDLLSEVQSENLSGELIKKHTAQITENENKIDSLNSFKSGLYENYVSGLISKDEYSFYKKSYEAEILRYQNANTELKQQAEDILSNKGERMKWVEHFKRFEDLQELDRKVVIQLIQSIKIIGKNEIKISFNYQFEYEKALKMLEKNSEAI